MDTLHEDGGEVNNSNRGPAFILIPYAVFRDTSIRHAAKLVYGRLKLYAGKNGLCNPKIETLAAEVCLHDRRLRAVLDELRQAGWIDWRRSRTSSYYRIHDQPETGGKLPDSSPESGGKLPDSSSPDRQKAAVLERQKTADRKEVVENHHQKRSKTSDVLQSSVVAPNPLSQKLDDDENQPQPEQGAKPDAWKEVLSLAPGITLKQERKLREKLELKGVTPAAFLERVEQNKPANWERGPVAALFSIAKDWSQPAADFHAAVAAITPQSEAKMTKTELELQEAIAAAPRRSRQENEILETELRAKLATLPRAAGPPVRSKSVQTDTTSAKLAAMGL